MHDLRHSAASIARQAGLLPQDAQEILGHASIATTVDVYTHVSPDVQREKVGALGDIASESARRAKGGNVVPFAKKASGARG